MDESLQCLASQEFVLTTGEERRLGGDQTCLNIHEVEQRSKTWKGACLAVQCLVNADPSGVVGCGERVRLPCLNNAVALHYNFAKAFMMLHVASLDLPSKQLILSSNSGLRKQDISKGLRFRCICIRVCNSVRLVHNSPFFASSRFLTSPKVINLSPLQFNLMY